MTSQFCPYKRCSQCGFTTAEDFEFCPKCGTRAEVIDCRFKEKTGATKRRRKCNECGYKYSTYEVDEEMYKRLINDREGY